MKRQSTMRRALLALALIALALAPTAALAQGSSYFETFDNGAPDWKLDGGWTASNGFLGGREQGSTLYAGDAGWHDASYKTRIVLLNGQANFTFMNTLNQWYYVALQSGDGIVVAQLYYTALGTEFPTALGSGTIKFSDDDFKLTGLTLEVVADGLAVDVYLNDQQVIKYASQIEEPAGTIGFEILTDSQIIIDEVSVEPPEIATETPTPFPGEDLALTGMTLRGVRQGSVIADLSIDVGNLGDTDSLPTTLVVYDREDPDIRTETPIDSLAAGDAITVEVSVEGPDEWANTAREFIAEIDPGNNLGETNFNNNRLTSGSLLLSITSGGGAIPANPDVRPATSGLLPVALAGLGVLALAAVVGIGLVVRGQMKLSDRKNLQKEAQQGKPPDHCTPPGRYVEVETEVELKLLNVSQIEMTLLDPNTRAARSRETITGSLPGDLNAAIHGRWLREPDDKTAERLSMLVRNMSKAIETQAYREKDICDVSISAHLEGIEVTSTFTLYHCKKSGGSGAWKKVSSWEVSRQHERDDVLFGLEQLDSGATSMALRLQALIEPMLRDYLSRY